MNLTTEQEEFVRRLRDPRDGAGPELLDLYPVARTDDTTVPTRDGETHVYIHHPFDAETRAPLFVNIHGGGFIKRHRDQDTVFATGICARAKCIVIDIDYAPTPEERFPYALHQCYDVVSWAVEHGSALGADPSRTAVCGHSSGGNFAAGIALLNAEAHDFELALQILDYPLLDLVTPTRDKPNAELGPHLVRGHELMEAAYIDKAQTGEWAASPILAPTELLAQLPPTLILTCADDMLDEEGRLYAAKLAEAGVPVTVKRFLHSDHGFTVRRKGEYPLAESLILDAVRITLGGDGE